MIYDVEIETRICGIPCVVGVTHYFKARPNPYADNDVDYRGYTDCDYEVLNMQGKRISWLEKKMSDADHAKVMTTIDEYYEGYDKDEFEFPEGL